MTAPKPEPQGELRARLEALKSYGIDQLPLGKLLSAVEVDAIMSLVTGFCREAIGPDEAGNYDPVHNAEALIRNNLRHEQRARLEASSGTQREQQ